MSKFSKIRYVGLDVHKDTIVIAVADEGRDAARVIAEIPFEWNALRKVLDKLGPRLIRSLLLRGRGLRGTG